MTTKWSYRHGIRGEQASGLALAGTVLLAALAVSGTALAGEEGQGLEGRKARESYSLGYLYVENLRKRELELDQEAFIQGVRDALQGNDPVLGDQKMRETLASVRRRVVKSQQKAREKEADRNLEESKAFLENNAKKEGVRTLESGLQYKVLEAGSGPSPDADDRVTVHYRGTLVDGTQFDSSYDRGEPETFQVDRIIPGWTQALQQMQQGAKWKLFVPPGLAYGEQGKGSTIPPNSALIFDIELLEVNKGDGGDGSSG